MSVGVINKSIDDKINIYPYVSYTIYYVLYSLVREKKDKEMKIKIKINGEIK
jgi:hypothetical protein